MERGKIIAPQARALITRIPDHVALRELERVAAHCHAIKGRAMFYCLSIQCQLLQVDNLYPFLSQRFA